MLKNIFLCSFLLVWITGGITAQPVRNYSAAEIKLMIDKLSVLGSVLYVAAHPDDENTSVLAYFSLGKKLRTGYLSLTRGDGGQNLIGSEKGDLIGVIRTNELLEARKIDKANQYFTRAIDFGYTKSTDETYRKWGKEDILSDIVWSIRQFKPDVIVTRFPPGDIETHGQHLASAQLAVEAFQLAGDKNKFSEQLRYVEVWQPKRIVWDNWLPYASDTVDVSQFVTEDIGAFNQLLGQSYTEISALSRSKHKSQGFGARGFRGERIAYFKHLAGDSASSSLFEGMDFTWSRIKGSDKIIKLVDQIKSSYDVNNPSNSIDQLIELYSTLNNMPQSHWIKIKIEEVKEIIRAAAGLWFEAIAEDYSIVPGGSIKLDFETINRSGSDIILKSISLPLNGKVIQVDSLLGENKNVSFENIFDVPENVRYSHPFWLEEQHTENLFSIPDITIRNEPAINPIQVDFNFEINGEEFQFNTPVLYRWVDRVKGEEYRDLEIRPPVTISLDKNVFLFNKGNTKSISIRIQSFVDSASCRVVIDLPDNWLVDSNVHNVFIEKKYGEQQVTFNVTPPNKVETIIPSIYIEYNDSKYKRGIVEIKHDHIPIKSLFPEANVEFISLNVKNGVENIGYVEGAGDDVKEMLEEIGYTVTELTDEMLDQIDLHEFDAVVTGVRAYNTRERIKYFNQKLLNYVYNGGTLVVQYNVSFGLQTNDIGPYPFTVTRDRVTDENSDVTILDENHPLLNYPNKIIRSDFDNWIQERGLYFAGDWDDRYDTILGWNDPGEDLLKGGLLYTKYGKGTFIYTGISFFRQLPAGVVGAYKIFVNLLNGGKSNDH